MKFAQSYETYLDHCCLYGCILGFQLQYCRCIIFMQLIFCCIVHTSVDSRITHNAFGEGQPLSQTMAGPRNALCVIRLATLVIVQLIKLHFIITYTFSGICHDVSNVDLRISMSLNNYLTCRYVGCEFFISCLLIILKPLYSIGRFE